LKFRPPNRMYNAAVPGVERRTPTLRPAGVVLGGQIEKGTVPAQPGRFARSA